MKSLPEFVPYFHGAYDAPAGLHYAGHVMDPALSCNGAQQGCSWGTLLFGLSRKQDMVDLIAAHPACLILSQSDDIFIVGPPTEVAACFNDWFDRIEAAHGVVNLSKCNVWSPTAAGTEHPDIQALGNAQSGSTGAAVAT